MARGCHDLTEHGQGRRTRRIHMTTHDLPTFADLCARTDGPPAGAAWGVFGDDDQIGTVNLLQPSRIVAGAAEVRLGQVHSLNWDIDQPAKNAYRRRPKRTHL